MELKWLKCKPNQADDESHWCSFEHLDLSSSAQVKGVYVIWHSGPTAATVKVGQAFEGTVADRLSTHRSDDDILVYTPFGLYVTWAEVRDEAVLDGVERYLGEVLEPVVPDNPRFPDVDPKAVNLPWPEFPDPE